MIIPMKMRSYGSLGFRAGRLQEPLAHIHLNQWMREGSRLERIADNNLDIAHACFLKRLARQLGIVLGKLQARDRPLRADGMRPDERRVPDVDADLED